jgi:hypothetical protein
VVTAAALLLAGGARADRPTVRFDAADQAKASATLLRRSDLPFGWKGGPHKPDPPTGPDCPGFEPKLADLVLTGHAAATFENPRAGVRIFQDAQVLESPAAVRTDFRRTVTAKLGDCLAHQYRRDPEVLAVSVKRLDFPRLGSRRAAYRLTLTVRTKGRPAKVVSDFVFVGHGRMEFSLNLVAPARFAPQLADFEADIVRIALKRGSRTE